MKKEFLENLGLTAEQIKGVQEENGKDIEKHKQATLKIETEKDELKTQLAETEKRLIERDKDLESVKSSVKDYDGLKQSLDELQGKYKSETETLKNQLVEKDYNAALSELLTNYKFSSNFAREGVISAFKESGHQLTEGKFKTGKEWLENLKKESPEAFLNDDNKPQFSSSTQGSSTLGKEPKTYSEMLAAFGKQ